MSDDGAPADGRLGSLFCRLHATRYCGAVRVSSGGEALVIAFHMGNPVFVEEPGVVLLSQQFVEDGLLEQAVLDTVSAGDASMTDLRLCARLVEAGRVPTEDATRLALDWVRTRILRAMRWMDCAAELDDSLLVPPALHAWSQPLGPLVYMGVRTFYGQGDVDALMADQLQSNLHFTAPVEAAVEFFGLDEDEEALLRACMPSCLVSDVLRRSSELEVLHAWHLLVLLRFAGLVDFNGAAPGLSLGAASGVHSMGPTDDAPTVPPPDSGRSSQTSAAQRVTVTERTPSRSMAPVDAAAKAGRRERSPSGSSYRRAVHHAKEEVISAKRSAGPRVSKEPPKPTAKRSTNPGTTGGVPGKRSAMSRLSRELERRRPSGSFPEAAGGSRPPSRQGLPAQNPSQRGMRAQNPSQRGVRAQNPSQPGMPAARDSRTNLPAQSEAHLKELVRRRMQQGKALKTGETIDPELALERAKGEMGREEYGRAIELMKAACEAAPKELVYRAFFLWARFRLDGGRDHSGKDATELRGYLKDFLLADEHVDFAAHALGFLHFAEEDYEKAERYLSRAVSANRRNRDAQRYLKIVRRRKDPGFGEPQKIFGIEISARVGKK